MTSDTATQVTDLDTVAQLAAQLRVDSIRSSTSAGSGHPTSSMSAADLIAVLAARHLRYDWDDPHSPRTTTWSSRRATRRHFCTPSSKRSGSCPTGSL